MITSYIKIALRNLFRSPIYSLINIGGLAIGMTVALLIGLWIYDELSFNKYHKHFDRIAQVKVNAIYDGQVFTIESHPIPLSGKLRSSFEDDFKYVVMSTNTEQHTIASGENIFKQAGRFMESDAPQLLSLRMVKGT
ncbi:MAG: ABC transporter permease, partial [Cyclobacteriaceae bacterium]